MKTQANYIYVLSLILLLMIGCGNPFETRTPESPDSEQLVCEPAISPQMVLENLIDAYEYQSLECYMQLFDSTFVFEADPYEREGTLGYLYRDWEINIEINVTQSLFEQVSLEDGITLILTSVPDKPDPPEPHLSATLYRNYTLALDYPQSQIPPAAPAQGIAIFALTENQRGFWQITHWEDQRQNTIDWGAIKGIFR